MKKTVAALAVAGTLAFVGAGAAQAATPTALPAYNGNGNGGGVSDGTVAPGQVVVFSSERGIFNRDEILDVVADLTPANPSPGGFGAGGPGRAGTALGGPIVLNAVVLTDTVRADANGNFSYSIQFQEEGVYKLTATGRESGESVTARVVVNSAFATAGKPAVTTASVNGGLANTGIDSAMFLWGAAGLGALGLGAGSIVVARRRAGAEA